MMNIKYYYPYDDIIKPNVNTLADDMVLIDHLNGFRQDRSNELFDALSNIAESRNSRISVTYHNVLDKQILDLYPNLIIKFSADLQNQLNLQRLSSYKNHPPVDIKNFVCSFNGSPHVGRKLLVSALHKFGYYTPAYCSKNMSYTVDELDGHVSAYTHDDRFYRKFFLSDDSDTFFQTINSFGRSQYDQSVTYDHANNIYNLQTKLTESFLHIVSETLATSYVPNITEKFLYSVVTRGLFLSYAQPGWHEHVEKFYGFKKYTKIFDYTFDSIENPIARMIELMTMISKFQKLSNFDLHDLYSIEIDAIDYNYDHYFSGDYFKKLKECEY